MKKLFSKLRLLDKKRRIKKSAKELEVDKFETVEDLFTSYYENNTWSGGGEETRSGSGSTLKKTALLRDELPAFLAKHNFTRMLDAPCGDYNWFREIKRPGVTYIGGDIVKEMVEKNQASYGDESTSFIHFDIVSGEPPEVDVWFCRDVLLHFSYDLIFSFLENFVKSGVPYLLVSNYHEFEENIDIPTGTGRPLNLQVEPFNLPEPKDYIDDDVAGRRPKRMALWARETVAEALEKSGKLS
ncbi:hypothetical protein [Pelagicoccus mobilis]|uniref:Class I SAM-dependent methyltransferase n=1 Tax=Pelagicoccus mobilis TaxID=415221 RepID=A0A934RR85_9BACT|nr:hypothetical protein [Pelagicoccus mobilis]MBK1875417.1 hypothetical protein [Pelagicoccus mobilis]